MQIVVTWFTFFGVLNFATLGWLAKPTEGSALRLPLVVAISILFVIQNLSAVITCLIMRRSMSAADRDVQEYEKSIASIVGARDDLRPSYLPIKLYSASLLQMAFALIPIASVWVLLPFLVGA